MSLRPSRRALLLASLTAASACGRSDAPTAPTAGDAASALRLGLPPLLTSSSEPTKLACPGSGEKEVRAVIGREGGTMRTGGFAVDFPAGAVSSRQEFSLAVPSGQHLEVQVHAVGHERYNFVLPVRITLDLARCVDVPDGTQAWYIHPVTSLLLEPMGGVHDKSARTFKFSTSHFSGYTLAWRSGEQPPSDSSTTTP